MYTTGIAPIQLEELSHMGPRDWFSEGSGLIHTTCILKPLVNVYQIERPHSAPGMIEPSTVLKNGLDRALRIAPGSVPRLGTNQGIAPRVLGVPSPGY